MTVMTSLYGVIQLMEDEFPPGKRAELGRGHT